MLDTARAGSASLYDPQHGFLLFSFVAGAVEPIVAEQGYFGRLSRI